MSVMDIDQIPSNLNGAKDSLAWHSYQAQLRTNELLEQLVKKQSDSKPIVNIAPRAAVKSKTKTNQRRAIK